MATAAILNHHLRERDRPSFCAIEMFASASVPATVCGRECFFFVFNQEEPNKIPRALKSETPAGLSCAHLGGAANQLGPNHTLPSNHRLFGSVFVGLDGACKMRLRIFVSLP